MKRLLLFAALLAWSGMSSAIVYKWMDAQGKIQYGDRPPDGVHAEVVEMVGSHAARPAAGKTDPSNVASGAMARAQSPAYGLDKDDATKKSVEDDVAQARDKQCADAQDRYKKLIEGRRIYKTGPDGERQYMTSEEIDNERVNAKRDADTICSSTT